MKKSRVVSLNKLGVSGFFKNNIISLSLCIVFAVCVLIGSITLINNAAINETSANWFSDYVTARSPNSFLVVFGNSLLYFLSIAVLSFSGGASMMGIVLLPSLIGYLGFKYGALSSYIYSVYGLKGIAFNAVILIPPTLIFLLGLFVAVKGSIEFSLTLSKLTLSKTSPKNISAEFKIYCGKYLVLLGVVVAASLIDSGLCRGFLSYFNF